MKHPKGNKGLFTHKITPADLEWVRDNRDADIEFLIYELTKRVRARGFEITPRLPSYIYSKIEQALST